MGNRYSQAPRYGYDHEWEDEEDLLSSSAGSDSHWHGKPQISKRKLFVGALITVLLFFILILLYRLRYKLFWGMWTVPTGLWSRDGVLTIGKDTPFDIKGVSWYGMELPSRCLEGLDRTSVSSVLDIVASNHFNAIRLPLALDNYVANQPIDATRISTFANPTLSNLLYRDLIDRFIQSASSRNILVLLDLHRLEASKWPTDGLWYNDKVSQDDVLAFWKSVASRFGDNQRYWNVIGADIFNEPHGAKNWTDWKTFVQKAANVIAVHAPSWIIVAEGVGNEAGQVKEPVFWAENLHPAYSDPPSIRPDPRKLVLSPHVYGPSVHNQSYFSASNFPENMPVIWDDHFGLANQTGSAILVGEFGGRNTGEDKLWHTEIVKYLTDHRISCFYWCLNPGSHDTGGIMDDNWRSVDSSKLDMLHAMRYTTVADNKWLFQRK